MKALITGGAGFFGTVLKKHLSAQGIESVIFDLVPDTDQVPRTVAVQGDIRNSQQLADCFTRHGPFDVVFHLAAQLAHNVKDKNFLWTSNVDGTQTVAETAIAHKTPRIVFTSSNCLWGAPFHRPVLETDTPHPIEVYGRSKWEGEKILLRYRDQINTTIIRCPTITDAGRLGLLSILFAFIEENKRVYVVGGGNNVYQFIYAGDLAQACLLACQQTTSATFNIGSDHVKPFRKVYQYVIDQSGSKSKIIALPKTPTILAMKLCYKLGLSPLGPYQYKMIAEDFVFATDKIKSQLGWMPTLPNEEMLLRAYTYYKNHKGQILASTDSAAHRQAADMGIIRLLKFFS